MWLGLVLLLPCFAVQTYTILNVESGECATNDYHQTFTNVTVGSSCLAYTYDRQGSQLTYHLSFPSATDTVIEWRSAIDSCSSEPTESGFADLGQCAGTIPSGSSGNGASIYALKDPPPTLYTISGYQDPLCSVGAASVSSQVIGNCLTLGPYGRVQILGGGPGFVYWGIGCGKGSGNSASASFMTTPVNTCQTSFSTNNWHFKVSAQLLTTVSPTTTTTTTTLTATTPTTTTTTTPAPPTTAPPATAPPTTAPPLTSAPVTTGPATSPPASTAPPTSASGPVSAPPTTAPGLSTAPMTSGPTVTSRPSTTRSAWAQLTEIQRIMIVLGTFVAVVGLGALLLFLIVRWRKGRSPPPKQTKGYAPQGPGYARLVAASSGDDQDFLDSEDALQDLEL